VGVIGSSSAAASAGDGVEWGEVGLERCSIRLLGVEEKLEVIKAGRGVGGGGYQDSQNVDGQESLTGNSIRQK